MARIHGMILYFTASQTPVGQPGPVINYHIDICRGRRSGRSGNHCVIRGRKFDHLQTIFAMLCRQSDQNDAKMTFWFDRQDYLKIRDQVWNVVDPVHN